VRSPFPTEDTTRIDALNAEFIKYFNALKNNEAVGEITSEAISLYSHVILRYGFLAHLRFEAFGLFETYVSRGHHPYGPRQQRENDIRSARDYAWQSGREALQLQIDSRGRWFTPEGVEMQFDWERLEWELR
jgi:hypothetical protein